jgi:hypothetical protein
VADDPTLHLIAELDANCAVMGAYYCGECLQCRASAELRRLIGYQAGYAGLIEDNSTYEDEVDRLRDVIRNYIKAEQDLQHATNDHFVVNYDEEVHEAHEAWKASWRALEKEANLEQ